MAEDTELRNRRELRVALVLNGGVSLAVWMGGVTHEIDLLRRASRVACGMEEYDEQAVAEYDRPVFAKWVELCRESDVGQVVVDVIAGTSAGGLNGTLLATAVARGVPLDPPGNGPCPRLRQIWDTSARLERDSLLRAEDREALPSVLDGDFFRDQIERVVDGIGAEDGLDDGVRRHDPVTLFVTATTLGTSNRPYVDSFGRGFGIADHRHLYRFRRTEDGRVVYRPGSGPVESWWHDGHVGVGGQPAAVVDDFSRGDAGARTALITAARASASFPVAFAPVREGRDLAARRVLPAAAVDCDGRRWLVDGGVLDNAPFEPVLDAISRRPATEPVRRLLVYVVPSRGQEGHGLERAQAQMDAVAEGAPHAPWGGILGSAIGFPREGDVRADMEYAAQLLGQGEATEASPEVGPEALFHTEIDGPTGAADGLFDQYRRARAVGGLQDVRNALARAQEGSGLVLAPAAGAHVTRLLAENPPWVPADDTSLRTGGGPPWQWGLATAERACRLMVRDLWGRSVDRESVRLVAEALGKVEAVRDAVALRLTHDAHTAPMDVLGLVSWTRARFAALQVQEALTHCVHSAAEAYAAARSAVEKKDGEAPGVQPADVIRAALTVEVATQAFTAYQPFRRTPSFEFLRLGPDVESAFVDCAGRSAEAAQHAVAEAESRGDRKLYGTRMQHFAAFGLPEWRAWDWTAGRLDAQTHLARAVRKGSRDRVGILDWTADVQRQTVQAELGLQPEQWAAQRDALLDKSDKGLIHDLRRQEYGNTLVVSVVDAVMRALPHELALDKLGLLLNSLLARKPQQRFVKWWAPVVRFPARRRWLNWTDSLGMDDGEPARNGHREQIRR